jgi:hypothetical protein
MPKPREWDVTVNSSGRIVFDPIGFELVTGGKRIRVREVLDE